MKDALFWFLAGWVLYDCGSCLWRRLEFWVIHRKYKAQQASAGSEVADGK